MSLSVEECLMQVCIQQLAANRNKGGRIYHNVRNIVKHITETKPSFVPAWMLLANVERRICECSECSECSKCSKCSECSECSNSVNRVNSNGHAAARRVLKQALRSVSEEDSYNIHKAIELIYSPPNEIFVAIKPHTQVLR